MDTTLQELKTPHSKSRRQPTHHTRRATDDEVTAKQQTTDDRHHGARTVIVNNHHTGKATDNEPPLQRHGNGHHTAGTVDSQHTTQEGPQMMKSPHRSNHRQGRHHTTRAAGSRHHTKRATDNKDITQQGPLSTETPLTTTQCKFKNSTDNQTADLTDSRQHPAARNTEQGESEQGEEKESVIM